MLALAFLLPFRTDTATGHVFYVSVTKVKWNPQQERLDLTVRIFTNDLEQAIKAQGGPELRLWTTGQHAESDRFVGGYLTSRIKFRIDGAERPLKYVGKADALDATACFCRSETSKRSKPSRWKTGCLSTSLTIRPMSYSSKSVTKKNLSI